MEAEASSSKWPFYATHRLRAPWNATGSTYSQLSDTVSIQSRDSRPLSTSATTEDTLPPLDKEPIARPLFHFHALQKITRACREYGELTCLHVSGGLMAVGCATGVTVVFDMSQRQRCVCGVISNDAVTALSMNRDATYLGVGHSSGHLYLYDMYQPEEPARHVAPIDPALVELGKGEGHLENVPITHLDFVGARKTALMSADARGLCFYHSLGRMLGMASNDTLRLYGQYNAAASSPIYAAASLPLGTTRHVSDDHQFTALLLPHKLLLIGLQPSARTWYRVIAPTPCDTAALAWLPATHTDAEVHNPMLAYAFGDALHILHLGAVRVKPRTEDERPTTGLRVQEDTLGVAPQPVVQLQWIHRQLLLVITTQTWHLYDMRYHCFTEWQPHDPLVFMPSKPWPTMTVWRSKAFVLAQGTVYVGDFVAWDARLSQLEADHEFVQALAHALSLYDGSALGSGIGLPPEPDQQKPVVARRIERLQREAVRHFGSFDADRFVRLCARAAVATQQFHVLFGDVYHVYEAHGQEALLVQHVEEYILHGQMRAPAPTIMQHLLSYRDRMQDYAHIEELILHVDPLCLDLDRTLPLCTKHGLWRALAYVYDYVLQDRITVLALVLTHLDKHGEALFPILGAWLRGLRYPTLDACDDPAKVVLDVQSVLFSQHAYSAPDGTLIPVNDADPWPYVRQLLAFDAASFLGVLDLALESDSDDHGTHQHVIQILLAVGDVVPTSARLFTAVFVARNAAKFPQFITLQDAEVAWLFDVLTQEKGDTDCEFALECLLSAHPISWDAAHIDRLERAAFWRVYETSLRKTRRWDALLAFYARDQDGQHHAPGQLFHRVAELFTLPGLRRPAQREALGPVWMACIHDVPDSLLGDVAHVVMQYWEHGQEQVLRELQKSDSPTRAYLYLKPFFPFEHMTPHPPFLCTAWIDLVAQLSPALLVPLLDAYDPAYFDLEHVIRAAKEHRVYDACLWCLDRLGRTHEAMEALDALISHVAQDTQRALDAPIDATTDSEAECIHEQTRQEFEYLHMAVLMSVRLCVEHTTEPNATVDDARELWFRVLRALMQLEHSLVPLYASKHGPLQTYVLKQSRALTQEALTTLITTVPSDMIALAHLFRRLIDSVSHTQEHRYSEVRVVVESMLAAYRLRCDVLQLGVQLNEADTSRLFQQLAKERGWGWLVPSSLCSQCHDALYLTARHHNSVTLHAQGYAYHTLCRCHDDPK